MRVRVAWFVAALTGVLCVVDILITATYLPLLSERAVAFHGFPLVDAAVVGSAVMGALIISRFERHPIGWLLLVIGFTSSMSLVCEAYAVWVTSHGGPGPRSLAGVAGWLSSLLGGQLSIALVSVMYLVSPDGKLLSPRWRAAAWTSIVGFLLCAAGLLLVSPTDYDVNVNTEDASALSAALLSVGFLLITGGLVAALTSLVIRWRRSAGVERQQLRLIALSAALITAGLVMLAIVQAFNGGRQTWLAGVPLFAAYCMMPILFAVAVLRYRMYDIDVIINRTVIVALGTAFAGLGYTVLVVATGQLVDTRNGGFWLSLLATAVVALAFQPLRRSVIRLANRLAYGPRAQPYEALSEFSQQLAETPSAEGLLPAVAEASGRAVVAQSVRVVVDVPGGRAITGLWPRGAELTTPDRTVPVRNEVAELGRIEVAMPKGRPLRASDERLLGDLSGQAALAFRNLALETQLAEHVAALDRTTQDLAQSRRRLVAADDEARQSLEAAIARDVLPHLTALPPRISTARSELVVAASDAAAELDTLVSETNAALESLRELTRGVFPTQLPRTGVGPALRTYLAKRGGRATVQIDPAASERFGERVEAAVYFACSEALRDGTDESTARLAMDDADLVVLLSGIAPTDNELQRILDRVEAAGGTLTVEIDGSTRIRIPTG